MVKILLFMLAPFCALMRSGGIPTSWSR